MHDTGNRNSDVEQLTRQAQSGDVTAFDRLIRRLQDRAVGYAFRLLRDRADAEDAAQEAFVQFWHDLPRLRDLRAAEGYLRRMVFKYCDRRRRAREVPTIPLDHVADPATNEEPFTILLNRERCGALTRAIVALPAAQRHITRLRYSCDLSLAEIAAQVDLPIGTVKNRLHAARKRLRKELWEMADDILTETKPSDKAKFTGQVLAQIVTEFERQMRADPHTANRALLTEAKAGLDGLIQQDTPMDFATARSGFLLLTRQNDQPAIATLMMHFLGDTHTDSETTWAYLHMANALAIAGQPVGAVLAHQAWEQWLPGRQPRLSPHWPYPPLTPDEADGYTTPDDCRLLFLAQSHEFASAYLASGRLPEYLRRMDTQLALPRSPGQSVDLRFYGLRIAAQVCSNNGDFARARGYIEQMYPLEETVSDPDERTKTRARTLGDHLNLLREAGDTAEYAVLAKQMSDLLTKEMQKGQGDAGWVRGERHTLAHQFTVNKQYADALPLWEENARNGGQLNGWAYLLHAGTVWHETGDRERTLSLLRDAAAHDDRDMTTLFQDRPEFHTVREDAAFLDAVKKPI